MWTKIILKAAVSTLDNHTGRRRLTQNAFAKIPCIGSALCPRWSLLPWAKHCCSPEFHLGCITRAIRTGRQQTGEEHKTVINQRELPFRHVVKISPHNEKIKERGDILEALRQY